MFVLARTLRKNQPSASRRALLFCAATLLVVPYVGDYDLVILLVPVLLHLGANRRWPSASETLLLFALASVGAWLRLVTARLGVQCGPLLWAVLLIGAAVSRVPPTDAPREARDLDGDAERY